MRDPVYKTDLWCPRGHFNEDQADKYSELCAAVKPRYVLEVGFCTGRSAACVLYNASHSLGRMVSVDRNLDWKGPDGRQMAALIQARFPAFTVIEGDSRVVLTPELFGRLFPHGIDFATVDGDHSYEGCMSDLISIAPFLSERGLMVVDDYCSGPPNGVVLDGVTKSVNDFLRQSAGAFCSETWNQKGKGFCIIQRACAAEAEAR